VSRQRDVGCARRCSERRQGRLTVAHVRTVIRHTTAIVFLLTLGTSGSAAQVPKDLLGTWSNNKGICKLDADPGEATIFTIAPKYIDFWEIVCLIRGVKPRSNEVDLNLECSHEGSESHYFEKLRVQRLPRGRLSLKISHI